MAWLQSVWSSIVVKVTALTVAAFMIMLAGLMLLTQTPIVHALFPRTLADNAGSIAELVWLLDTSPEELQPFILSAYQGGYRAAAISDEFSEGLRPRADMKTTLANAESDVSRRLQDRDVRFQTLSALPLQARLKETQDVSLQVLAAIQVAVELDDGRVLDVWLAPAVTLRRQPTRFLVFGLMLALFAAALGFAVAAVTLRPIRRLEQDAARVELGDDGATIAETGPIELQRISAALNRMRSRLSGLIREREQMVAAIAHDVRTGLTRIRLRMDDRGEVSADEIEGDVAMMETLISDMLVYARAESPSGPQELVRLAEFVGKVAAATPVPVSLSLPEGDDFMIVGDPIALRRLFENLIENSRRYGGGDITIRVTSQEGGRQVRIEDDGPGLPEDQIEAVFEPFRRGESSRNRSTGGIGLGLGIARAIARTHGATLRVENRLEGGLAAVVDFPEDLQT